MMDVDDEGDDAGQVEMQMLTQRTRLSQASFEEREAKYVALTFKHTIQLSIRILI